MVVWSVGQSAGQRVGNSTWSVVLWDGKDPRRAKKHTNSVGKFCSMTIKYATMVYK